MGTPFYPYYRELQKLTRNMTNGNFGLWFNKFTPVSDFDKCKPCDEKGNDNEPVMFYFQQYQKQINNDVKRLLEKRHIEQASFCKSLSSGYSVLTIKATLTSPLVTGIGHQHPHEISMVFDHNLGIPYIPASSLKGIVRFAHLVTLIANVTEDKLYKDKNGAEYIDEDEGWTGVSLLFGSQEKRGKVIFLDSYPEDVPNLHVDIMNPHYGPYYSDDSGKTPPADYHNPTPIKFLTVAPGTTFIFRVLADKSFPELREKAEKALVKAISEEGVGAKTALGYGIFGDLAHEEAPCVLEMEQRERKRKEEQEKEAIAKAEEERLASLTEEERIFEAINSLQPDSNRIAMVVRDCLSRNLAPSVYEALKEKLIELGEWKPYGSKQKKRKMRKRNADIESRINH